MINSISVINNGALQKIDFSNRHTMKREIDIFRFIPENSPGFDIQIDFSFPIAQFRNHDYTWIDVDSDRMATEFSPKAIRLSNGMYVQANIASGIWEVHKKKKNRLLWRFRANDAYPVAKYSGTENKKHIKNADFKIKFHETPALLFSKTNAVECSRSKIAFTAIAVFTDHCDFDTPDNLKIQREFFAAAGIRITKGFFLNHYSKRTDNASYEKDKAELEKWKDDGHELCYHSLSQSIKPDAESFSDFRKFTPPFPGCVTWIDHGYQPYNVSLFENSGLERKEYENVLKKNDISIIWNYVDCGTASSGVINQLNRNHFTLGKFLKGNSGLPVIKQMQLMAKHIIFQYYGDDKSILTYKKATLLFKNLIYKKKVLVVFPLLVNAVAVLLRMLKVGFSWNSAKNKLFRHAKFTPILFRHTISKEEFYVFQTVEMTDFIASLSDDNIESLIMEKGVVIAHTYFSVPMDYHTGKFLSYGQVNEKVASNFRSLGEKIKNNRIWNPTLSELADYWSNFEKYSLDINECDEIIVKNDSGLIFRKIK